MKEKEFLQLLHRAFREGYLAEKKQLSTREREQEIKALVAKWNKIQAKDK